MTCLTQHPKFYPKQTLSKNETKSNRAILVGYWTDYCLFRFLTEVFLRKQWYHRTPAGAASSPALPSPPRGAFEAPLRTRTRHIPRVCWKHGFLWEWPNDFGVTGDLATGLRAPWGPAPSAAAGPRLLFSALACALPLLPKRSLHSEHNSSFASFDSGATENAVAIETAWAEHTN